MIETIKNLPEPVIIAISVLAYIIIAIIFTFLLGLVMHDEDYSLFGLMWIVAVPMLLFVELILLFDIIYHKANEVSLRHYEKVLEARNTEKEDDDEA